MSRYHYYNEYSYENVWHQRLLRQMGRIATRVKPKALAALAVIGVTAVVVHLFVSAWRGDVPLPTEILERANGSEAMMVTDFNATEVETRANETLEKAKLLYGVLPEHVDAYTWFLNRSDERVHERVLEKRITHFRNMSWLQLVSETIDDSNYACVNTTIERVLPLTATGRVELAWLYSLTEHLIMHASNTHSERQIEHYCACGAQFGVLLRHLAIYTGPQEEEIEEKKQNDSNTTKAHEVFHTTDADTPVLHLFNMYDHTEAAYDELDATQLRDAGQGLVLLYENQDERYNDGRGEFAVVRRTKLKLTAHDVLWHRDVIHLSGPLAICAQRCLDLMRGIDVRARARMQWERSGVRANSDYFERAERKEAMKDERTSSTAKGDDGEMKDEL